MPERGIPRASILVPARDEQENIAACLESLLEQGEEFEILAPDTTAEGAQILAELGVHDMILLTNSHRNVVAIEGYGLNIVGERPITAE